MSQNDRILAHLKRGRPLTPAAAMRLYGTMRLAARVYELRTRGHQIQSDTVQSRSGARIARYWMAA